MPQQFGDGLVGVFVVVGAAHLRNANRKREHQTDAKDKRHGNQSVGKRRARQRNDADLTNHRAIDQAHQHLSHLTGNYREREGESRARLRPKRRNGHEQTSNNERQTQFAADERL